MSIDVRSLVRFVNVELGNQCNRKEEHTWCPLHHLERGLTELPTALIYSLLDELGSWGYSGMLQFSRYNEPTCDPRFEELMAAARERLPHARLHLTTNGDTLTAPQFRWMAELGNVLITVSLYGTLEQQKARYSQMAGFFHSVRERRGLTVRMVPPTGPHVASPLVDIYDRDPEPGPRPCLSPIVEVVVTRYGKLGLCCLDWLDQHIQADLTTQSLEEALSLPAVQQLYEELSRNERRLPLCQQCGSARGYEPPWWAVHQDLLLR